MVSWRWSREREEDGVSEKPAETKFKVTEAIVSKEETREGGASDVFLPKWPWLKIKKEIQVLLCYDSKAAT